LPLTFRRVRVMSSVQPSVNSPRHSSLAAPVAFGVAAAECEIEVWARSPRLVMRGLGKPMTGLGRLCRITVGLRLSDVAAELPVPAWSNRSLVGDGLGFHAE